MMIEYKSNKNILEINLDRPQVHNAFNPEMIEQLTNIFSDLEIAKKNRVAVLSAKGESFCAGADLNWMKSMAQFNFEQNLEDAKRLFSMFETIKNYPLPIIGRVFGSVFGGGVGLVSVCDIVAAEEKTKFSFSEGKLGLLPAVISPFIKRKMSPSSMREVFLTAEVFESPKAKDFGLIHFHGDKEEVEVFISEKIKGILSCAPSSVTQTKKLLNDLENWNWEMAKDETPKIIAKKRIEPEGQEGLKSFLDKKKPKWLL